MEPDRRGESLCAGSPLYLRKDNRLDQIEPTRLELMTELLLDEIRRANWLKTTLCTLGAS